MIAIPAVDLREGACVQLVGGSYDDERIRLADPPRIAQQWIEAGFKRLHVVDLDAATGKGNNSSVIREILRTTEIEVQVGGGIRSIDQIEQLLSDGARRVVVGTKGIEDPSWLAEVAEAYPDTIILAADVRDRHIVTSGWGKVSNRNVIDFIEEISELPLAGVMVTAVHKEGQMLGTDLPLMEDVVEESVFPVLASGGVGTLGDLRALEDRGVAGVIIGMALYTGAINARSVADEFSE